VNGNESWSFTGAVTPPTAAAPAGADIDAGAAT